MFYLISFILGISIAFDMGYFFYYDASDAIKSIFKIKNENRIRFILILFLFTLSIYMGVSSIYIDSENEFIKYLTFGITGFSIGGVLFSLIFSFKNIEATKNYKRYINFLSTIGLLIILIFMWNK